MKRLMGVFLFVIFISSVSFATTAGYLFKRGTTCWKTGRFDVAIRYFTNYRKLNGSNSEVAAKATFWVAKCYYYKCYWCPFD